MIENYWKVLIDGKPATNVYNEMMIFESEEAAWKYVEDLQDDGFLDPETQHIEVCHYVRY